MASNSTKIRSQITEKRREPFRDLARQEPDDIAAETTLHELTSICGSIHADDHLLRFVHDDGFLGVVNCMKAFPEHQQVQSSACLVLIHLFRLHPGDEHSHFPRASEKLAVRVPLDSLLQVERRLVEQGLIQLLVHALNTYHDDQCLRNFGIAILLRIMREAPDQQESEAIAQIVESRLTSCVKDDFFVDMAVQLLYFRVKLDSSLLKALLDHGILQCLSSICTHHSRNVGVQRACCTLFFIFCDLSPLHRSLFQGHISTLIRAAKDHLDDVPLVIAACGTIWHVTNSNEAAKADVCIGGGVSLIIRVLMRHARVLASVDVATGILKSLAQSTDARVRRKIIGTPLVLEAIVAALYRHHHADDIRRRITATVDMVPEFASLLLGDMDG